MVYADGCIGCTSPTGADSRSAKATIARQSGGRRMLLNASSPQEDNTAIVPAAPLVTTVARSNATTVHVEWATPDNGGAALTGYNVFRKTGAGGTYARLGGTPTTGAARTSYDDTAATDTTAQYFYKVTALNSVGEGTNCGDFSVGALLPPPSPCSLPGVGILTDEAGDIITPIGQSANPGWDLRSLSIAEPFGFVPDKLVFTLKVENLTAVPANTRWPIQFVVNGNGYFVDMSTYPTDGGSPAAPVFKYGTFNPTGGTGGIYAAPNTRVGNADAESTFTPDGNIRIVVSRDKIGNPAVGQNLTGFLVRVRFGSDAAAVTPDNMPQDLGPTGSYTVAGNASCAPNAAPVAPLSASPTTGVAPVTVNFNASASFDPDAGDSIASSTFNFGDGSAPVTQAGPTISHTYADDGSYQASVAVTDTRGATSDLASQVIRRLRCRSQLPQRGYDRSRVPQRRQQQPQAHLHLPARPHGRDHVHCF
ncbi:MAG: PKD domain-containing protein [Opitutaceae bacterium]